MTPERQAPRLPVVSKFLSAHWTWGRLDDLCVGIFDCPHSTPKLTETGPFVARTQDILTGVFRMERAARVSYSTYLERTKRAIPSRGDLLYSREGTYFGVAAEVPEKVEVCLGQRMVLIRPNHNDIDFRFLRHWLNSPFMASYISGFRDGSVAERLNLSTIRSLPILKPPLKEQAAIAEVACALEGKIAVNDSIVATGRQLTASLLERVLCEDAHVSVLPLSDVAEVNKRKVNPVAGGNLRYIDISSVSVDEVEWPERMTWDLAPGRARRGVSPGDTIWSTVRPGRRSRALILDDDPELVVSTGFAVLTPSKVGAAFLYEVTRRDEFAQYLESVAEGSAYPAVRAERFKQAPLLIPSPSRLEEFEKTAIQMQKHMHSLRRESRSLAKLRDMLLPKLMSGEIKVRDAEKAVEDAL